MYLSISYKRISFNIFSRSHAKNSRSKGGKKGAMVKEGWAFKKQKALENQELRMESATR